MQFDVITRPIAPDPIAPGDWWMEDPPTTFPQHGWMDFADENGRGLCVVNRGVYEFGVKNTPRREVALTLLRSVGYLGAGHDPMTIAGGAGPNFPTPEAQLLGRAFTYRLALCPHGRAWHADEVWRDAAEFLAPPRTLTQVPHAGERPPEASWLRAAGKNAVVSAVKRAEAEDALIVRLYNPSDEATTATLTLPRAVRAAALCNLNERTVADVPVADDGAVSVALPPKKIVTVKLVLV
jgi:mannosylglycerate hydrolase